ncbi:unnamed protein product [Effrenium voratum]|uniref:Uncharacterized protein n=1 Tax=Effrenium voratum TaxID=2562239 RepID=A0AA36N9V4_9DINO|nr:unnamed protein product [Effrenium voratum]CAJ1434097.1 unnamed protein product [Effrenium voratum]
MARDEHTLSAFASTVSSGTQRILSSATSTASVVGSQADVQARRLGHKTKQLLASAMEKLGEGKRLFRASLPPLPAGLHQHPEGTVELQLPSTEAERLECLRDLGRTMLGGSILVLGRRRLYPVRPESSAVGAVSAQSCGAALEALQDAIAQELLDQGFGLNEEGAATALMCRRGTLGVSMHEEDDTPDPEHLQKLRERKIDQGALRTLAEECAVNISVSPGMQLVVECGLPPTLLQPTFVICLGGGQVRVLTFAFVGGPVTGDRPDRKRTPFSIRLATDDLIAAAAARNPKPRVGEEKSPSIAKLRYAAHAVDPAVHTTLDMIVLLEEELFQANEVGDWKKLAALDLISEEDLSPEAEPSIDRKRMESESWAVQTDLAEGPAGQVAHSPAGTAQLPGLPQEAAKWRFSWLLQGLRPKAEPAQGYSSPEAESISLGLAGSVYGTGGL